MSKDKLADLLHQYFNNTISPADCAELIRYVNDTEPEKLAALIDKELTANDTGTDFTGLQAQTVFDRIRSDPRYARSSAEVLIIPSKAPFLHIKYWLSAAAILLCCIIGATFMRKVGQPVSVADNQVVKPRQPHVTIKPGGIKATLTLAGGQIISLNDAGSGLLARTGNTSIQKTHDGQIIYNLDVSNIRHTDPVNAERTYNTLSTGKGGEYQVTLPDGTKVWLNSASSLIYPTEFTGSERQVKLTGEAYFEVAKNKEKPFYVDINKVQVRVLGTHFNITAYNDDDQMTATLLEGAVRIIKNSRQSLLKPGEQAVINNTNDRIAVSDANVNKAMAWKNGYFIFNEETLESIMKKVSRWYDVQVEYQGYFSDQKFGGTFNMDKSITELLHNLEKIGNVHFKVEESKIIVMK